jgi:hypothetical protein
VNKSLTIYTELDSIYDPRQAILSWLATEGISDITLRKAEADRKWGLFFEKNYRNRRLETYEFPDFGITREKFEKAYAARSLSQWALYRPSNVLKKLLKTVFEIEQLEDTPLGIKGVTLYLNYFPYQLDPDLQAKLTDYVNQGLRGIVEIKLVNSNPVEQTTSYYKQFHYVLKYDILLGKDSKAFTESLATHPIPEVAFFVPDVFLSSPEGLDKPPADILFGLSLAAAASARLIPISHDFYDYRD